MCINDECYYKVKEILAEINAIVICGCGDFFWTVNDEQSVYPIVINKIKEKELPFEHKEITRSIKQILLEGDLGNTACPHCGAKRDFFKRG